MARQPHSVFCAGVDVNMSAAGVGECVGKHHGARPTYIVSNARRQWRWRCAAYNPTYERNIIYDGTLLAMAIDVDRCASVCLCTHANAPFLGVFVPKMQFQTSNPKRQTKNKLIFCVCFGRRYCNGNMCILECVCVVCERTWRKLTNSILRGCKKYSRTIQAICKSPIKFCLTPSRRTHFFPIRPKTFIYAVSPTLFHYNYLLSVFTTHTNIYLMIFWQPNNDNFK